MTPAGAPVAYLDASAFVKLLTPEPESLALRAALEDWPVRVSSQLLEIEAGRFALRAGEPVDQRVAAALERVSLIAIGDGIRKLAGEVEPAALRSLDAIHLATALSLGSELGALFAYDRRLLEAVEQNGLLALSPS